MADIKMPAYKDLPGAIARVRDSHLAVHEGIATAAEKHRDAMDAKRNELHQRNTLRGELQHGQTTVRADYY